MDLGLHIKMWCLILIIFFFLASPGRCLAACVSSTPDYTTLAACVSAADRNATIAVSSGGGSETWGTAITLTKGVNLVGPGVNSLTVSCTGNCIVVSPDSTAVSSQEVIGISGFTFNGNNRSSGQLIVLSSPARNNPFYGVKIHDNKFVAMAYGGRAILAADTVIFGVIYSNIFDRVGALIGLFGGDGHNNTTDAWDYYVSSLAYGSNKAIFFEDNTVLASSSWNDELGWVETGQGFPGMVVRYNTWDYTNQVNGYRETWDVHGLQNSSPPGTAQTCSQYSSMSAEFYGNYITTDTVDRGMNHRGSWLMMFNNNYFGSGGAGYELNEYGCNSCATGGEGYNQQINNTYVFNNYNGPTVKNIGVGGTDNCSGLPLSSAANSRYWNYNSGCTSSNCTSGIGVGANTPTGSCTTGVGYWKWSQGTSLPGALSDMKVYTQSGIFYKCTSTNTWTPYYKPYTYPHPLRGESPIGTTLSGGTISGGQIK